MTNMETKEGNLESLAQTTGKITEKEEPKSLGASASIPQPAPAVEDVPDPDEDDLDDLDGLPFHSLKFREMHR